METPLKSERIKRNLSTTELAKALRISQPTLSRIENGKGRARPTVAKQIEAFFKGAVTRDQILFPEEYGPRSVRPARLRKAS